MQEGKAEAEARHPFHGLGAKDLPIGLRIVCTDPSLQPPKAVAGLWAASGKSGGELALALISLGLDSTSLVLAICDLRDERQRSATRSLIAWLRGLPREVPIVLLPAVSSGVDMMEGLGAALPGDIILGRPSGFDLAFAVNTCFCRAQAKAEVEARGFRERAASLRQLREVSAQVQHTRAALERGATR